MVAGAPISRPEGAPPHLLESKTNSIVANHTKITNSLIETRPHPPWPMTYWCLNHGSVFLAQTNTPDAFMPFAKRADEDILDLTIKTWQASFPNGSLTTPGSFLFEEASSLRFMVLYRCSTSIVW